LNIFKQIVKNWLCLCTSDTGQLAACYFPALALGSWKCKQFAHLFLICQVALARRQVATFSVFKSSFHLLLPVLTNQR